MLRINYATNNGFSEEHTGANVPLFVNQVDRPLAKAFSPSARGLSGSESLPVQPSPGAKQG